MPVAVVVSWLASNTASIDVLGSNLVVYTCGLFYYQMAPTAVESAYYSVGRHNSTRVDEGKKY